MDIFISLLPLIVMTTGLLISLIAGLIMEKFYLETETILTVVTIIIVLAVAGVIAAKSYGSMYYSEKAESYYTEIENLVHQSGYTVYMNGSVVDADKIVISDYPDDKIHINDELKEIYISNVN